GIQVGGLAPGNPVQDAAVRIQREHPGEMAFVRRFGPRSRIARRGDAMAQRKMSGHTRAKHNAIPPGVETVFAMPSRTARRLHAERLCATEGTKKCPPGFGP